MTELPDDEELEQIVRETVQGKRVVLFPPGLFSFVATNMFLLVSFSALVLPLLGFAMVERSVGTRAIGQLVFIVGATGLLVFPALLVIRGNVLGMTILRVIAIGVTIAAAFTCLASWWQLLPLRLGGPALAVVTGSVALVLLATPNYSLLARFFQLRIAMMRERRTIACRGPVP